MKKPSIIEVTSYFLQHRERMLQELFVEDEDELD